MTNTTTFDLYEVSLRFLLLRQRGLQCHCRFLQCISGGSKMVSCGDMPVGRGVLEEWDSNFRDALVLINPYFLLGHAATKDSSSSDDLANIEGIISSIAQILSLLDDLGNDEHQEGNDGSYIEYLMKEQQGLANEDARQHALDMVSNTRKDVKKWCFSPSAIPLSFQKAHLNVARMVPMMYTYDENHCLPVLEEHIKSIFCDIDGDSLLSTSLSYMAP